MATFCFTSGSKICDFNIRKFCKLFIYFSNLWWKLTHMANAKNLWFLDFRVDSKQWTYWKCSSLARSILTLSNQINVLILYWLSYHRYSSGLNFGWLKETKFLNNAFLYISWNGKDLFIIPRSLLVDECTSNIFRELVLNELNVLPFLINQSIMLRCQCFCCFWLGRVWFYH